MTGLRKAALIAIGVLVAAASLTSFAESYRSLYVWSSEHGLHGAWAVLWPLQIDTFIGVGELALFVAMVDRWASRSRVFAWLVVITGLAASVAGNVGHAEHADLASRLTAAVPPLAAAAALTVGLGVLKRVVASAGPAVPAAEHTAPVPPAGLNGHAAAAVEAFAADLASGAVPGIRRIRRELHVGQPRAEQVRAYLAEIAAQAAPHITRSIAASGAPANPQVTDPHMGDG